MGIERSTSSSPRRFPGGRQPFESVTELDQATSLQGLLRSAVQDSVLPEQYYLAACLNYHAQHPVSPFSGVEARYLFDSVAHAVQPMAAEHLGYTHLIAGAKRNPELIERLERRVREAYPEAYARVERYCTSVGWR